MANSTRLTNLEVTGELKAGSLALDIAEKFTALEDAPGSYNQTKMQAFIDAVKELQGALGYSDDT